MANKNIKVQYQLRGDTLENLNTKNAIYAVNEPILVLIAADSEAGTKAAVLMKIGDGKTAFKELPYVTALAGDVPSWAKEETKPTYTAEEIGGLDSYISGKVEDTDTQYKLEQDTEDAHILKLFSKGLTDTDWTLVGSITTTDTVYDDTELSNQVSENTTAIETLNGDKTIEGSIEKKIVDIVGENPDNKTISEMISDAAYDDTELKGQINTLVGEDTNKSIRTIATEELAKQLIPENAKESMDTLTELAAWIQQHPDDVTAINKAISDLQTLVGTLPEDATSTDVVSYVNEKINAAITALKIGDYAKAADLLDAVSRISANETAIANKVDKVEGKGLSTNDYTDEEKTKLNGIASDASKVEASETNGNIKVNGTEITVYTLPDTVIQTTDTIILDGGTA